MKCPDGHGEMTKLDPETTISTKELWRCLECRKLIQVFYASDAASDLQKLVDILPDRDDDATS